MPDIPDRRKFSRRDFLNAVGWGGVGLVAGTLGVGGARAVGAEITSQNRARETFENTRQATAEVLPKEEAGQLQRNIEAQLGERIPVDRISAFSLTANPIEGETDNFSGVIGMGQTSYGPTSNEFAVFNQEPNDPTSLPDVYMQEHDGFTMRKLRGHRIPNSDRTEDIIYYLPGRDPAPAAKAIPGAVGAETVFTYHFSQRSDGSGTVEGFRYYPPGRYAIDLLGNKSKVGFRVDFTNVPYTFWDPLIPREFREANNRAREKTKESLWPKP